TAGFTKDAALRFLASWVDIEVEGLPVEAHAIAKHCEYLPLALAISGALVRHLGWADILSAFRSADLSLMEAQLPNYPHRSVGAAIAVSVNHLQREEPEAAAGFLALGIFQADAPISKFAVHTYWSYRYELSDIEAKKTFAVLSSRCLLLD